MAKTAPLTFKMPFESNTIDHLGLRLYSTLPPVIAEIVSNAHDAESPKVEINIPEGPINDATEVIVRDFGHGMTAQELQDEYLPIGRNRRGDDSSQVWSKSKKVKVTGRKGLGKLSVFGVANEMELRTIRKGNAIALRFSYAAMREWSKKHPGTDYEPELIESRSGQTKDQDGTEVRLRGFHRKHAISMPLIRRGLARRARYIGTAFQVLVNGTAIGPGDRIRRESCELSWNLDETPVRQVVGPGLSLTGWVGFLPESSQTERGIDIFANKKAVELGSFFNFSTTHAQFARAHIVGEIHADFLDETNDLAATARNSVVWESLQGEQLEAWGQSLLKWAFDRWIEARKKKKETEIITIGHFDQWLQSRAPRERKIAKRLVDALVADDNIEASSTAPLLEVVKASVETLAFHELIETMEEHGPGVETLLQLFAEWRVLEAREHLRLSDGRRAALEELRAYIDQGALEVKQMQPLFEKNPWLIDNAWSEVDGQSTYTKLLRENCVEPKDLEGKDRRMDILGIATSGFLTVVEIKQPKKTLSRGDLEQVEDYVDWARAHLLGTGPASPKLAAGLLIVGQLSPNAQTREKARRLGGDGIRVETYDDIYNRALEYYGQVDRVLRKIAPEYRPRPRKPAAVKTLPAVS